MADQKNATRVTVRAVLSYVNVFEPYIDPKGKSKPKYKCLLLIDKTDKESVAKIKKAIKLVEDKMVTEKYAGKMPKKGIDNTFIDGDAEKDGEEYEGRYCINVSKHVKPVIVDRRRNPITDEGEIYSGVVANVAIEFYYYWMDESKGITASLEAIQKVADGEPLGAARVRAEDVFDEIDEEEEDLDELD
jgi:hypothetical protein